MLELSETRKLYNAGDRIVETLAFSLPDGHDIHCVGHLRVEAPARGVFQIPATVNVCGATVFTHAVKAFVDRHGHKGVVLIDANADPDKTGENEPVAPTEEAARTKAAKLWKAYCRDVVRGYFEERDLARAQGGAPRGAAGFVKRAMEVLGMGDPDERLFQGMQPAESDRVARLERELAEMRELVQKAVAGKGEEPRQPKLSPRN